MQFEAAVHCKTHSLQVQYLASFLLKSAYLWRGILQNLAISNPFKSGMLRGSWLIVLADAVID